MVPAPQPARHPLHDIAGPAEVLLGTQRQKSAVRGAFQAVRATTEALAAPLQNEDMVVQTMPDVSPTKWHLAHTTWFFRTFLVEHYKCDCAPVDPNFGYLFNSYYQQVGEQYPRPQRGWLSRPTLEEVLDYRRSTDLAIEAMIDAADDDCWPEMADLLVLGMHHEKQHQELILTDIKHVLSCNPLLPAAYPKPPVRPSRSDSSPTVRSPERVAVMGRDGNGSFCFDCETPMHRHLLSGFQLEECAVTNGQYLEFMEAGGYCKPEWWPSDGWAIVSSEGWEHPLYWYPDEGGKWMEYSLHGLLPLDPDGPVCHLSWYEAQAYASFRGARLPTEAELECSGELAAGVEEPLAGRCYHPCDGRQVWLWTGSAFLPYPGFCPPEGAIGEYNGKFMSGQMVLRGGSCLTPEHHLRSTYRNFFPPQARWQMAGIRLAQTVEG